MIHINLDMSAITSLLGVDTALKEEAKKATIKLTEMTKNHILEESRKKLHTRQKEFSDKLTTFQTDDNTWVINLDKKAVWINDGLCVVYAPGRPLPKVLTPDGEVKLTDVKIGMLVLNQFGKWTKVSKIHDNDLYDFCVEYIDEEETLRRFGYRKTKWPRSHKKIVVACPNCGVRRETKAFTFSDVAIPHCPSCIPTKKLVTIHTKRQGHEARLVLTADHQVLTGRGWVPADKLLKNDTVCSPAWGVCKWCGKKVLFGGDCCSGSCHMSKLQNTILPAILANHTGEIELLPSTIQSVRHITPSKYTGFTRRWDITVEEGESFVCQGMVIHNSSHNMVDSLLKGKGVKRAKDGSQFKVIPFDHSKGKQQMTPAQQTLASTIKSSLSEKGFQLGKIINDKHGKPAQGLVMKMDINHAPLKSTTGPGQGKGAVGQPMVGPTGIPLLKGVRVYQRDVPMPGGKSQTKQFAMTFRIVSSKHKSPRWDTPGVPPTHLMEDGAKWALQQWEKAIVPDLLISVINGLK